MKTNLGHGFVLAVTFTIIAACGGSQAETIYGADGGTLTDSSILPIDTGKPVTTTPDTGVATPDTGSTFIDSGSGTGDTGVVAIPDAGDDTAVPPTGDGGGVCPSSCTADTDCQSACPASPGAINCCDTVTSACFTSAAASCPDETSTTSPDAGSGGY